MLLRALHVFFVTSLLFSESSAKGNLYFNNRLRRSATWGAQESYPYSKVDKDQSIDADTDYKETERLVRNELSDKEQYGISDEERWNEEIENDQVNREFKDWFERFELPDLIPKLIEAQKRKKLIEAHKRKKLIEAQKRKKLLSISHSTTGNSNSIPQDVRVPYMDNGFSSPPSPPPISSPSPIYDEFNSPPGYMNGGFSSPPIPPPSPLPMPAQSPMPAPSPIYNEFNSPPRYINSGFSPPPNPLPIPAPNPTYDEFNSPPRYINSGFIPAPIQPPSPLPIPAPNPLYDEFNSPPRYINSEFSPAPIQPPSPLPIPGSNPIYDEPIPPPSVLPIPAPNPIYDNNGFTSTPSPPPSPPSPPSPIYDEFNSPPSYINSGFDTTPSPPPTPPSRIYDEFMPPPRPRRPKHKYNEFRPPPSFSSPLSPAPSESPPSPVYNEFNSPPGHVHKKEAVQPDPPPSPAPAEQPSVTEEENELRKIAMETLDSSEDEQMDNENLGSGISGKNTALKVDRGGSNVEIPPNIDEQIEGDLENSALEINRGQSIVEMPRSFNDQMEDKDEKLVLGNYKNNTPLKITTEIANVDKDKVEDAELEAAAQRAFDEMKSGTGMYKDTIAKKWARERSLEELEKIDKDLDISRQQVTMQSTIAAHAAAEAHNE